MAPAHENPPSLAPAGIREHPGCGGAVDSTSLLCAYLGVSPNNQIWNVFTGYSQGIWCSEWEIKTVLRDKSVNFDA